MGVMEIPALLFVLFVMVVLLVVAVAWLAITVRSGQEGRHREMLADLRAGLDASSDRIASRQGEEGDRLRRAVSEELERNRQSLHAFERTLQQRVDERLGEISGRVNERLEDGFRKTNETFLSVMTRLQAIDEAQKKIDALATNVVSLQNLLGSKSARGALGERQLEDIVRNALPASVFEFQYTFPTGARADCVLKLPEPTGLIAIDSKFPLENYERMLADGPEKVTPGVFRADVKRHVDAIASKYIIPGTTTNGAIMFCPAESVFAEIHAHHRDVVEYAQQRCVWITSPTTLMAVLNTARAVLKDVETRRQIHIIKDELGKLGREFGRFDERMKKLADHIRQAHEDVTEVAITGRKISDKFAAIERAELPGTDAAPPPQLTVVAKSE
ncbi:MAG TPA: DNA recombination protein RmuC [Usitatibacter sp.]|nr:DNA recombination protein RmuC [Usitatibacter sp.]